MPTFGTIKRQKPRIEVLRGYDPNEPTTFTQTAPVKDNVTIQSGQVISLEYSLTESRYEWTLGVEGTNADANAITMAYIALQDSTDEDVLSAGNMVGLSCAGQFEIESAFFASKIGATDQTYDVDVPITYAAEGDQVTDQNLTLGPGQDGIVEELGYFKVAATSGDPIIGYVTRGRGDAGVGNKDLGPQSGANGAIAKHAVNSNVIDTEVVTFYTNWGNTVA
jgi:hypothetical protein